MAIDPEKITEYTGIKAETTEEFISEFQKKFYTEDQIFKDKDVSTKFFGRAFGSATTGIKQIFDSMGVEITGDDLKQPIEAVVKNGLSKLNDKFQLERTELEKTAGLSADEKIKEFQEAVQKKDQKIKDFEKLLKEKANEFESLQTNQKQQFKEFKLKSVHKDLENSIQWNPDKDEYSRKGFLATMAEKYQVDLDENDEPFIIEKKTGSRIKAEGSHSTFMNPIEVFKQEAIKAGIAAVNKKAGQPAMPNFTPPTITPPKPPTTGFKRPLANTRFRPQAD